jgi:hypothetical protein
MGALLIDLMNPIIAEHPDLRPKELHDKYSSP